MVSLTSLASISMLLAQGTASPSAAASGGGSELVQHLLAVIVFSVVGIVVLGACFWIMKRLMPFSVTKEIEEDQNTSLAILMGSVIIGMSIIIAAAIHG